MSYQELIKNQEQNQNQQHFFQFIMGTKSESKLFSSLEPELKQIFQVGTKTITNSTGFSNSEL